MLLTMSRKVVKVGKHNRPPRIRVPNQERAIFTVEDQKFLGTIQRLSATGGSVLLAKGSVPQGSSGEMILGTVFGKVSAHIEFLQTGADGVPLAQAFRFITMDDVSMKRFTAAAEKMQSAGFGDAEEKPAAASISFDGWNKFRQNLQKFSEKLTPARQKR
jgi:hypothetical protein